MATISENPQEYASKPRSEYRRAGTYALRVPRVLD
ncbi:MAG: hypothetical protein QOH68_525 [Nocardioidaceae bacterium]|nr:hypothetical protein [Nocardioidaceae bacterium]